jgi:hypothetical protein
MATNIETTFSMESEKLNYLSISLSHTLNYCNRIIQATNTTQ